MLLLFLLNYITIQIILDVSECENFPTMKVIGEFDVKNPQASSAPSLPLNSPPSPQPFEASPDFAQGIVLQAREHYSLSDLVFF